MSKFQNGLRASAAPAPAAKGEESELQWERVTMGELSPKLQEKFEAMLDAQKAFEDTMIAESRKQKLIDKDHMLVFSYRFLKRGQVSIAEAPIKRQTKAKSRFAL
jgi:hypothetical protein